MFCEHGNFISKTNKKPRRLNCIPIQSNVLFQTTRSISLTKHVQITYNTVIRQKNKRKACAHTLKNSHKTQCLIQTITNIRPIREKVNLHIKRHCVLRAGFTSLDQFRINE